MLWFYSVIKDSLERCQKVILIKLPSWWRLTYLKCPQALAKLCSSVCAEHLVCATGIKWHASCHYTAGVFCPSPVSLGIMFVLDNSAISVQFPPGNKYALYVGMWRGRVWRLWGWMGVEPIWLVYGINIEFSHRTQLFMFTSFSNLNQDF